MENVFFRLASFLPRGGQRSFSAAHISADDPAFPDRRILVRHKSRGQSASERNPMRGHGPPVGDTSNRPPAEPTSTARVPEVSGRGSE